VFHIFEIVQLEIVLRNSANFSLKNVKRFGIFDITASAAPNAVAHRTTANPLRLGPEAFRLLQHWSKRSRSDEYKAGMRFWQRETPPKKEKAST